MSDDNKEGAGVPVAEVDENPRFTTAYPLLNDLLQETWWMAKGPNNMDTGMAWYESLKSFLESIATPPAVMPAAPSDAMVVFAIEVEKLLCKKLSIDWAPAGMSIESLVDRLALSQTMQPQAGPIDMVLHCPKCGLQHVDAPEDAECDGEAVQSLGWGNPPHKSHLCHGCGHIWRPADVPTNGVQAVKTTGKADSPIAQAEPAAGEQAGAVAIISGEPATALSLLDALIDIYDDAENKAPEHRCYVEGAWEECLSEARAFLAAPGAAIAAREQRIVNADVDGED